MTYTPIRLYHDDIHMFICDWLWENPPVMHKDNYQKNVIE